jgi:uncharacterized protein YodC (DUF2158 family)
MTHTFQTGDTVALKSGGTAMTIDGIGEMEHECVWLDESGKYSRAFIDPRCLAPIIRKSVVIDSGMHRCIWVFAETGLPIVDHVATAEAMDGER